MFLVIIIITQDIFLTMTLITWTILQVELRVYR